LSSQALGLGSCWIQVRERFHTNDVKAEAHIKEVLGIPDKYTVECMLAVGYPAEEKRPYEENELLYDKIHHDKY
jgi:nitroreductase